MIEFKPMKGKAFEDLPASYLAKFKNKRYVAGIKYDGNQIFIVKQGKEVRFFTRDWKEFKLAILIPKLDWLPSNFVLVAEFMHDCEGKLGDRRKSAILTTYRTNFKKGLANNVKDEELAHIRVFDCIFEGQTNLNFDRRLHIAHNIVKACKSDNLLLINYSIQLGEDVESISKSLVKQGWEGLVLQEFEEPYKVGKRVNHVIKVKHRKTADLLCIGVEEGTGKCNGIGSLTLKDSKGRIVNVGSGLDYSGDTRDGSMFIGKVIEIEYEQIMDTYIQPVFVTIREDKSPKEID